MTIATFTLTQGGADTAAQVSIPTFIVPGSSGHGWKLERLEVSLVPDTLAGMASADSAITIQATKRSLAGNVARIEDYADDDLLASVNFSIISAGTPANIAVIRSDVAYDFYDGRVLYAPYMYVQLISDSTGLTLEAFGRVHYTVTKLSTAQQLALLGGA